MRAGPAALISLSDVEVPVENRIGAEVEGLKIALIQAGFVLRPRDDRPVRCKLPAYDIDDWRSER